MLITIAIILSAIGFGLVLSYLIEDLTDLIENKNKRINGRNVNTASYYD